MAVLAGLGTEDAWMMPACQEMEDKSTFGGLFQRGEVARGPEEPRVVRWLPPKKGGCEP